MHGFIGIRTGSKIIGNIYCQGKFLEISPYY